MALKTRFLLAALLTAASVTACARQSEPSKPASAALNVSNWTDKTELYMEYPPIVSGQPALFAVHLTKLDDFQPLAGGQAKIEFVPDSGGQPIALIGPKPSRPGAFRVEGQPPTPGRYRWALAVEAPDLSDRHDLGTVTVFTDQHAADLDRASHAIDDPSAIAYLKEQQWMNEFATAPVSEAEVRTSIRLPATVEPLPGGEAIIAAPAAGRLIAESLPSIGDRVRAGQALARIEPRLQAGSDRATLAADVAEAQAAVDAAQAEQARSERLLADRAVPGRRVEDARRSTTVAEARLRAAEARLAQRDETLRTGGGAAAGNAFVLRTPIGGRVAVVSGTPGASYDEGAPLFKVVRTDRVELQVQVPVADVSAARAVSGVALELPGRAEPLPLDFHHVHDPGVIDSTTRALPLQMEIENPGEQLLVGQAGTAILYTGQRQRLPAVPKAAVLMEAGRPYVFVQVGGERFSRRFVEVAGRDGDLVAIRSGVKPRERVVTRGAYDVQLASAAKGLPAEGHVH